MPYVDKEKNRMYQREWARRKREGLKTSGIDIEKIKPYVPHIVANGNAKLYSNINLFKRNELKNIHIGKLCKLCKSKKYLNSHRKDGSSHQPLNQMSFKKFKIEITSNKYVRLCVSCHNSVHKAMRELDLWELINKTSIKHLKN